MPPTFALTFDAELMWGSFDRLTPAAFDRRYPDLRATYRTILTELDAYDIPATWAVVGHLFLDRCERSSDGRAHPDLLRPSHKWFGSDWFSADPCGDLARHPLWYGSDLLDAIQGASVNHEIGSHSFSHPIFGDPGVSQEVALSEIGACVQAASARGITLRSFTFPRNQEGHHAVLRDAGFTAFRGLERTWYQGLPRPVDRAAHLVSQGLAIAPPVSHPEERLPGLWDVPGSMLLLHRVGLRRLVPIESQVRRARAGLQRAIETGGVFHLWTHAMNVASDASVMLPGLRAILREAARQRDRGMINVETMAEIARRASTSTHQGDGRPKGEGVRGGEAVDAAR